MFNKLVNFVVQMIGKVHWKQTSSITIEDKLELHRLLAENYYVILTHRRNHLSTYAISIANFFLTGKFSFWSHCLMNLEDEIRDESDFRLIEAIGTGTQYSSFESVFGDVDAVVLLKPKGMTPSEWTEVMEKSTNYLGEPYDTLFDLSQDKKLSCVELVRCSLKANPEYDTQFVDFEKTIASVNRLTPQMFYDCVDFEIVFEVRR